MSTQYKRPEDVPTEVLADRLDELADVICKKRDRIDAEFTMRIPAECDRDADIVLSEAARRLREQDNGSAEGGDAEFIAMPSFLRRDQESSNRADGWDAEAYNRMRGEIMWWKEKAEKAEELIDRLRDDLSPTYMGEPMIPAWTGWACQYPDKMPRLYGSREIAELNCDPENGDRLLFLASSPQPASDVSALVEALEDVAQWSESGTVSGHFVTTIARKALAALCKGDQP